MNWLKANWKFLAWGLSISVGVVSWIFSVQNTTADMKLLKPRVEALSTFKDVQGEVNRTVEKKLDKIIDILSRRR